MEDLVQIDGGEGISLSCKNQRESMKERKGDLYSWWMSRVAFLDVCWVAFYFIFVCRESEEREGNLLLPRYNVEDGNGIR